jgi:hypothetical protein
MSIDGETRIVNDWPQQLVGLISGGVWRLVDTQRQHACTLYQIIEMLDTKQAEAHIGAGIPLSSC